MKVHKQMSAEEFRAALGKRIKALREERGSDQRHFAGALGISQGMLSRIENGRADITIYRLREIATALGTTTPELLEPLL